MRFLLKFFICIFFSCISNNELEFYHKCNEYVDHHFNDYASIYDKANLWLESARKNRQENVRSIVFDSNYMLDKMLLVNKEENKCVGIVNLSNSIDKNSEHDWIFMISGIKINNEWKFIRGGSLYVPRENYIFNINKALNHDQLSYIGRDFFLQKFLISENKKFKVNSEAISKKVTIEGHNVFNSSDPIKNWNNYINDQNNKIISDKEFNKIQENLDNQVPTDKVLPEKGTKEWKELYGNKIPLFEREEWKNLDKK